MAKLIIRDDDMNFFTKLEDVERVYSEIREIPVSFAVIPMVTDVSTYGNCPDTKGNAVPRDVLENTHLVSWIKDNLKNGKCDVLMHGITHGYKFISEHRLAEMEWRDEPDLADKIIKYRDEMSRAFDYDIKVFVAPSNKISKYGIDCVSRSGMDFSGIIPLSFQRHFDKYSMMNYLKRWSFRFFKRLPYPGLLDYHNHLEMNACIIQGYDYLTRMYSYCEEKGLPMAVNVHYWHLRDNPQTLSWFIKFCKWALDKGAEPCTMTQIMKAYHQKRKL